jgi:hypothetical protein
MAPYVPSEDSGESKVSNGVYITGFNSSILAGNATIFTSDFNGNGYVSEETANHVWTYNVVLDWDAVVGAYVVTSSSQGAGNGKTPAIQLTGDMILIAVHDGGGTSTTNKSILSQAKVGQVLNVYGIDLESRTLGVAPYVTITDHIRYQTKDNSDVRLIAYVDDYTAYTSVEFILTIDGEDTDPLACTTAYSGLYAGGKLFTTEDIYGRDGYFVTYVIEDYIDYFSGSEVTITTIYKTVSGESSAVVRTATIGE